MWPFEKKEEWTGKFEVGAKTRPVLFPREIDAIENSAEEFMKRNSSKIPGSEKESDKTRFLEEYKKRMKESLVSGFRTGFMSQEQQLLDKESISLFEVYQYAEGYHSPTHSAAFADDELTTWSREKGLDSIRAFNSVASAFGTMFGFCHLALGRPYLQAIDGTYVRDQNEANRYFSKIESRIEEFKRYVQTGWVSKFKLCYELTILIKPLLEIMQSRVRDILARRSGGDSLAPQDHLLRIVMNISPPRNPYP